MANWWSNLQERAALAKQKQEEAARKQAGGGKPKNGPQDRFRNKR
jgi:hypothetical protein